MAGFGGSPSLAILTGISGGVVKKRETERAAARQQVLNRMAQTQVDSMVKNQERLGEEMELKRQEQAIKIEEDRIKAESLAARNSALARGLMEANPDLDPELAQAAAGRLTDTGVTDLVSAEDPMEVERDRIQLESSRATLAERLESTQRRRALEDFENHPSGLANSIRIAVQKGAAETVDTFVAKALQEGFTVATINDFLEDVGGLGAAYANRASDDSDPMRVTREMRDVVSAQAPLAAATLIAQYGTPEAALASLPDPSTAPSPLEAAQVAALAVYLGKVISGEIIPEDGSGSAAEEALSGRR